MHYYYYFFFFSGNRQIPSLATGAVGHISWYLCGRAHLVVFITTRRVGCVGILQHPKVSFFSQ